MRVILDTNVLLGALISPNGPPDAIYRAWRAGRFDLVTSTVQLAELRRASRYPRLRTILPAHRVGTMVNNLQRLPGTGFLRGNRCRLSDLRDPLRADQGGFARQSGCQVGSWPVNKGIGIVGGIVGDRLP